MGAAPIETELKFLLEPEAAADLLAHPALQGEEHTDRLRSVYFDTAERDLRCAGFGLRVRRTGGGFVQGLKRQDGAGAVSRQEWESPVPGEAVDAALLQDTPAHAILDGRALAPVFSTTVKRLSRLCRAEGVLIEASLDAGEVSVGGRSEPIHELELELKDGDVHALFALGRQLAADFSVRLSFESKAERGYRLADKDDLAARASADAPLSADLCAAEAFQRIARACLAQVCANAEVLRRVRRPEAVHQMRVGLRRLRAAFAAFKPMLADRRLNVVEAELKWLAGELDRARDIDVFVQSTFRPAAAEMSDAALAPLGRQLLKAQSAAYDRALKAATSRRYAVLTVEAAAWIEAGRWTTLKDPVLTALRARPAREFAIEALDHLRRVVRRRGHDLANLDHVSRHKLRIRAKRLRYATEFFAPLFEDAGKSQSKFLRALKRMQDRLGELNDLAVARDRILRDAGLRTPELALAAGRLIGRREKSEKALLDEAVEEYDRFRAAPAFWREAADAS
ncbi:MAG: CHAD domain-containing protein [Caulobacteraceae bacterium]